MKEDSEQPKAQPKITRVPWQPWLGLIFVLAVFYTSQVVAGLVVEVYALIRHWSSAEALAWLNDSVTAQFMFILVAEVFTVGAIYLFLKRRYQLGMSAIGLKRPRFSDFIYGLAAVLPYFILYALTVGVVSHFVHGLDVDQEQQIGFNNVQGPVQMVLTFISLVILPPLAEEIIVRGFLYSTLKKAMPTITAALATSALFAAAHLQEGGTAGLLWIGALDTFVLSMVLIYLREKTGSLWASITLHAAKNAVAFTTLFVLHVR